MRGLRGLGAAAIALLGFGSIASADTVLATFSGGNTGDVLQAQAQFSTNGTDLFLTVTNTSSVASTGPANTLNAVLFNGSISTFQSVSATITAGSAKDGSSGSWQTFTGPTGWNGTDVGGEWGLGTNVSSGSQTWNYGISSSGLNGMFGDPTFTDSGAMNLAGPVALDGNEFGIVSGTTFNVAPPSSFTGNNNTPVVSNSVTFDLGKGTTLGSVSSLLFVYGTNGAPFEASLGGTPNNPSVGSTAPLPSSALGGGMCLAAVLCGLQLAAKSRRSSHVS